jgi:GH25 family lysozyme M1 (1,4-beta-N-acetylmuramidase)
MQPIIVDVYANDLNGKARWAGAAADARVNGAILKATEGTYYRPQAWLTSNWTAIKGVARDVGTDWFCGAYHYLIVSSDGDAQAAYFAQAMDQAGGLDATDLWPMVDLEEVGNNGATRQQSIDTTSAFVEGIQKRCGRSTMLYAGSYLREHGITDRMGCNYLWTARYTPTLPQPRIDEIGWTEDTLWGWQYQGTGKANVGSLANYPTTIPGFADHPGDVDLSVMVFAGGLGALKTALAASP